MQWNLHEDKERFILILYFMAIFSIPINIQVWPDKSHNLTRSKKSEYIIFLYSKGKQIKCVYTVQFRPLGRHGKHRVKHRVDIFLIIIFYLFFSLTISFFFTLFIFFELLFADIIQIEEGRNSCVHIGYF